MVFAHNKKEQLIKLRLSSILLKYSDIFPLLTISKVILDKQTEKAQVYFSIGGKAVDTDIEKKLNKMQYLLRRKLAQNLPFKRVPAIEFCLDQGLDYLFTLNQKLKNLSK